MRPIDPSIASHPFVLTVERMLHLNGHLTAEERSQLAAWEKENLGPKGTSDWPGWAEVAKRVSH